MVKILLTSDIHLGIKVDNLPIPEHIRINTLRKISSLAKEHDLFLIAGDLFDGQNISRETLEILANEFKDIRAHNVEIIYTPGDAETNVNGKLPLYINNLSISHIFTNLDYSIPYDFLKDGQRVYIYGSPIKSEFEISTIKRVSEDGFHIGLFHANFNLEDENSDTSVCLLHKNDIKTLKLDFYAFGHHHNFKLIKYLSRIIGAYPGSPEATSLDETGERFVLSLTLKGNEIHQIKRLNVNSSRVKQVKVNCTDYNNIRHITDLLKKNNNDEIIILTLIGERNFILDLNELYRYKDNYLGLIVDDQSIPQITLLIEEFIRENSLRGEFFSILKEKIDNGEVPPGIDLKNLSYIINSINRNGKYQPEDWLSR
jgi:DNA repair exonuclease SbcCD nuclease subunit